MLLIHPPSVRTVSPPLALARLAAFLRESGVEVRSLDLAREGVDYLIELGEAGGESAGAGPAPAARMSRERPGDRAQVEPSCDRPGDRAPTEPSGERTRDRAQAEPSRVRLGDRARSKSSRERRFLESLYEPRTYLDASRHARAAIGVNRALKRISTPLGGEAGLADYREAGRSPLRSADLVDAARRWRTSPWAALYERRLPEALSGFATRSVGVSIGFLSQALPAMALAGFLRETRPDLELVAGGGLVTSWSSRPGFDERAAFGGFFDAALPGRGEDALAVRLGIGPVDPFALAPDFSDFSGLSYLAPGTVTPWNLSFGCPWKRCSFCPERTEDSPYAAARAADAMALLRAATAREGSGLVHLTDNEISPRHLKALANGGIGAPWYGFARFTPLLADPGFCRTLAASGCVMLQLGLESGDQRVLDSMGKGTELRVIDAALRSLAEAGIKTYVYILFGTPSEDRDAALRTRDFVAGRAGLIDFMNVAIFNMPIGSPEAELHGDGTFYEGDLSLYTAFDHPGGWNRGAVRRFLASEFGADPGIASLLGRNPPIFTSSHAPFLPGKAG
ncbi:MAG TPA: radical SAM protein [Spirochaetales bacterium]|nr:radical SAM protein [Spirochaetales bacterium]